MRTTVTRRILIAGIILAGIVPALAADNLTVKTLSSRPDNVSGGDALVELVVPQRISIDMVVIKLNGQNINALFRADQAARTYTGLVTGLKLGPNNLEVFTNGNGLGRPAERLTLTNYPLYGPIFAGPHQVPWICETAASGLGYPLDEHCTVATRYEWFYRSTDATFKPLPTLTPPFPTDLAQTTTIDGHVVNYIARVESGTIDQSIYRIAILDDPTNPISTPWSAAGKKPGPGWNGKLTFPFGGGASPAFRSGRNLVTSALQHDPLSLGFAVAFGTRNTFGTGADDVISAETVMMIKERFIEQYGLPKFTIGSGGSGGSMQQHLIAQNYPGLLDAITPGSSYPDLVSILPDVLDCRILANYFNNIADPADWPGTRQVKVDGYAVDDKGRTVCQNGWGRYSDNWQNPFTGFDPVVPAALRYDPVTNPKGARGTYWDGQVNVFGIDPHTGFARSAYDNVGVQYGLKALNNGDITKEEFLDLNEKIGGLSIDGKVVSARSEGDLKAVEIAYRTGRVNAGENLTLPIIDTRGYRDQNADIHTRIRTFAKLERLKKTNGTTANEVNWLTPQTGTGLPNIARMALLANNEWLENILADTSADPYAVKVIRNKPAFLKDACWDATGVKHEEPFTLNGPGVCNTLFPTYSTVRIAAGGPIAGDILKCQLKPVTTTDYTVTFTAAQLARLQAIFPQGVCDYTKPGVGQQRIVAPGSSR